MALPEISSRSHLRARPVASQSVERVRIRGFKSIRDQEVVLKTLNVLVGANGVGKSNFLGAFRFLHEVGAGHLKLFVAKRGGADTLLRLGRKVTKKLELNVAFKDYFYDALLVPTDDDGLVVEKETIRFPGSDPRGKPLELHSDGSLEDALYEGAAQERRLAETAQKRVLTAFDGWRIYHFSDTSSAAKMKLTADLHDNAFLRGDAGNLAAFLYLIQETDAATFRNITETIRMVAPFFDSFRLRPDPLNEEKIRLEWKEEGASTYFGASALSDGTLRFIAIATLLLQTDPPATILLDEPELGLHPAAISLVAALLESASTRTQVIVSTQSVTLLNQLTPEQILVVDRRDGVSEFRRLDPGEVESWLDDYALGEVWEKNVIGGGPFP